MTTWTAERTEYLRGAARRRRAAQVRALLSEVDGLTAEASYSPYPHVRAAAERRLDEVMDRVFALRGDLTLAEVLDRE